MCALAHFDEDLATPQTVLAGPCLSGKHPPSPLQSAIRQLQQAAQEAVETQHLMHDVAAAAAERAKFSPRLASVTGTGR